MEFAWRDDPSGTPLAPGGILLSCFPSAGLATTVAAHYIVRTLHLPRVGLFESNEMPPIAVIQGGEVNPPIRVYGRKELAVVLSEFPPTPAQSAALARTILAEAARRQARWVIGFEGVVPHPVDDLPEGGADSEAKVWSVTSPRTGALTQLVRPSGAEPLEEGVISGVSGALLVNAIGRPVPVVVLLVSARVNEGFPDHRAGAALIEVLDRLVPELRIDTGPLRAQAAEIEKALRSAMKGHPAGPASPEAGLHSTSEGMYQ